MAKTDSHAEKTDTVLSVRVDKDLAKAFKNAAKANNRNQSILLRDFITEYVSKNRQQKLPL